MNTFTKLYYREVWRLYGNTPYCKYSDFLTNLYNNRLIDDILYSLEEMVKYGYIDGESGEFTDKFFIEISPNYE